MATQPVNRQHGHGEQHTLAQVGDAEDIREFLKHGTASNHNAWPLTGSQAFAKL